MNNYNIESEIIADILFAEADEAEKLIILSSGFLSCNEGNSAI